MQILTAQSSSSWNGVRGLIVGLVLLLLALSFPTLLFAVDPSGDLYALIIGVSKYKNPKIRQLNLSDKDARDFAEFLRNQKRLFRKIDVTLICNEQATKAEIEKNLNHKLRQAGKDDTVVVFFSGHGSDDPATPGEFFFVTYDSDPNYLTATGVNMNQNRVLNRLDSKRVVLIADACYAGNFTSMGTKSLRPALENFIRDFSESRGRVFFTSSRPDELSMEKPGLKNSVFTHYLLKGLSGEADKDGDGIVGIKELYDYVYEKTRQETNHLQHPQWEAKLEGSFPLALTSLQRPDRTEIQESGEVRKGLLGVSIQDLNKNLAASFSRPDTDGALILEVIPGSPAEKAGLTGGDIVLKLNDEFVTCAQDLTNLVRKEKPRSHVKLTIFRDRKVLEISAKLMERIQSPPELRASPVQNLKLRWGVIKDKNGVCKVIQYKDKTPDIIAGPFTTKEAALALKERLCP